MTDLKEMVSVRYMVDDVQAALDFYTKFLGFEVLTSFPPAFERAAAEIETRVGFLLAAIRHTTEPREVMGHA